MASRRGRIGRAIGGAAVLLFGCVSAGQAGPASRVADAAMNRDTAALRALLEQRHDVNAAQPDGATALQWAAYYDDRESVDLLLRRGADVGAANIYGMTALSLAAETGDAAVVSRLLAAGADPNTHLPNGETALMLAARNGSVTAIEALLDRGAAIDARESLRGTTALMWAAEQGHADAVRVLAARGADVAARSNPAERVVTLLISPIAKVRGTSDLAKRLAARPGILLEDRDPNAGGVTALAFAARQNSVETVRELLAAGADINQATGYGWSPLLIATYNRFYQLGAYLLGNGADPNVANRGGWTPLYLATDNRNIESGDYPVRKADMDHLEFIRQLLEHGADVNARMKDSTDTRTVFTQQWLFEDGATAFLRAAQSSDLTLMRLLLEHGADPKIATTINVTALHVAAGIGWVDGITYEWSEQANLEAVRLLLDLGLDPNAVADTGTTPMHGAAHKGRNAIVQLLADRGARLDARDYGTTDNRGGKLAQHRWQAVDYADGLVRIGTQSPIPHPETAVLIRKLMTAAGLPVPPVGRTLETVCPDNSCDESDRAAK